MQEQVPSTLGPTPSLSRNPSRQQLKCRRKQIIQILKKVSHVRRPFKIVNELMNLIKDQPLFQPLANNYKVISQVCQKIQYRRFNKGQLIYRIRYPGDFFYLLLQGTVHLTLPEHLQPLQSHTQELQQDSEHNTEGNPSANDIFSAFLEIDKKNINNTNGLQKNEPENKNNHHRLMNHQANMVQQYSYYHSHQNTQRAEKIGHSLKINYNHPDHRNILQKVQIKNYHTHLTQPQEEIQHYNKYNPHHKSKNHHAEHVHTHHKTQNSQATNQIHKLSQNHNSIYQLQKHLRITDQSHKPAPSRVHNQHIQQSQQVIQNYSNNHSRNHSPHSTPYHHYKPQFVQKIIRVIEPGQYFGEMMQQDSLRETNAVAIEPCDVVFLNRKSYDSLLKAQLKSQSRSKYLFLQQIPLFQAIGVFPLSRICILMREQHYLYGQPLFGCGDPITYIHVIRNGSFKLMRRIGRHSRGTAYSKIQHKRQNSAKKDAEYLIVQEGEVLGDGQTLQMHQYYQQSCVCESQEATVLVINKKEFFKILLQQQAIFQSAKEIITNKNRWKNRVVNAFIEKRTRNSFMNAILTDPKRSCSDVSKKAIQSLNNIKEGIMNEDFFYHQFNKTIVKAPNHQRFSISNNKCRTQVKSPNLMAIKNHKKQGVPHGIQDIIQLVKLKASFQKRFRKDKKMKYLFKFNEAQAPLYIKSRFGRIN